MVRVLGMAGGPLRSGEQSVEHGGLLHGSPHAESHATANDLELHREGEPVTSPDQPEQQRSSLVQLHQRVPKSVLSGEVDTHE